jgi:hypothetical protein
LKADGLLGLSPKTTRTGADTSEKVHLLVTELKNDGIVDKAMFAVYLGDVYQKTSKSKVSFGGYDESLV